MNEETDLNLLNLNEASTYIFDKLNLNDYSYLNIHFIPNILSDTCSIEVKELLDGYKMADEIALVIVTCNSEEEADVWRKENSIPDSWNLLLDHDRSISKKFSNLNKEYDIPERLSCLINKGGDVLWEMKNSISEKRDMLLSNKFNESFSNSKNIEQ